MLEILLLFIIFVSLIYISIVDSIFFSILISGIISFVFILFYIIFKAPDIALTEVAIGSAISTVLFTMTLLLVKSQRLDKRKTISIIVNLNKKILFLLVSLLIYYFVNDILNSIPLKRDEISSVEHIGDWYILNSNKNFHIPSIVTSIIVGFRALDTLFETLLIIVSSFIFLRIMKNKEF